MDDRGTALLEKRPTNLVPAAYQGNGGRQAATDGLLRELAFVLHATQTVRKAMHRDAAN